MNEKIAVVLPCYRSEKHVLDVIARIGPEVSLIIAVDDACPQGTGAHIEKNCTDQRVKVVRNKANQGVGGAVIHGYRVALASGADIVVKIDSDGQMDPALLPQMIHPILIGRADYVKGNRFFNIEDVRHMPAMRVLGNAGLSFLTKLSSGYWNIFDPTNGYTAIHRTALGMLPLAKIDRRFFFESDMLFRLYMANAVVFDVPIRASYGDEESNLRIGAILIPFFTKNVRNFLKRVFYRYYLRDMNLGSLELLVGSTLFTFGTVFGLAQWVSLAGEGVPATAGTVMLASLPFLVGVQMILGFFAFDFMTVPSVPLQIALVEPPPKTSLTDVEPGDALMEAEGPQSHSVQETAIRGSEETD
jgi:glycosyltransferase involved in cell wall biosynthesis